MGASCSLVPLAAFGVVIRAHNTPRLSSGPASRLQVLCADGGGVLGVRFLALPHGPGLPPRGLASFLGFSLPLFHGAFDESPRKGRTDPRRFFPRTGDRFGLLDLYSVARPRIWRGMRAGAGYPDERSVPGDMARGFFTRVPFGVGAF